MGALGAGREAIAAADARREQAAADERKQVIDGIMDELGDTLAEPVFEGDVETALIHHMGKGAFYEDEMTGRYTGLAKRIDEEAVKDKRRGVPVLIVYREHPNVGRQSVFIRVPRGEVQFRSEEEREEGVRMHAFTGRTVHNEETDKDEWQPDTAAVTHKRLSIVASVSTFRWDILESGQPVITEENAMDGFTLSESHVADGGRGAIIPSDYAFSNYSINRLGGDIDDVSGEEPEILVGWNEIEDALMSRLVSGGKPNLEEVERLEEFFRVIGGISGFEADAPRIAAVMKAAEDFQAAVSQ